MGEFVRECDEADRDGAMASNLFGEWREAESSMSSV